MGIYPFRHYPAGVPPKKKPPFSSTPFFFFFQPPVTPICRVTKIRFFVFVLFFHAPNERFVLPLARQLVQTQYHYLPHTPTVRPLMANLFTHPGAPFFFVSLHSFRTSQTLRVPSEDLRVYSCWFLSLSFVSFVFAKSRWIDWATVIS